MARSSPEAAGYVSLAMGAASNKIAEVSALARRAKKSWSLTVTANGLALVDLTGVIHRQPQTCDPYEVAMVVVLTAENTASKKALVRALLASAPWTFESDGVPECPDHRAVLGDFKGPWQNGIEAEVLDAALVALGAGARV